MTNFQAEFERLSGRMLSSRAAATRDQLSSLEQHIGNRLPDDYRSFLSDYGGSKITAKCRGENGTEICTEVFYGFSTEPNDDTFETLIDELGLIPNVISIAQDAFGGQFVLFLHERLYGNIFFYDTEGEDDFVSDSDLDANICELASPELRMKPEFSNFDFIATNFTEFIQKCQPI